MTEILRTAIAAAINAVPQELPTLRDLCGQCGITPNRQQRINSQSLSELLQGHLRLLDTKPETVDLVRAALQQRTLNALEAAGKAAGVKGTTSQLESWLEKVEKAGIGKGQTPAAVSIATLAAVAAVTAPAPVDAQSQKPAADEAIRLVTIAVSLPDDTPGLSKTLRVAHVTAGLAKDASDVAGTADVMRKRLYAWLQKPAAAKPQVDAKKPAPTAAQPPATPVAAKPAPTAVYPTIYIDGSSVDAKKLEALRTEQAATEAAAAKPAIAANAAAIAAKEAADRSAAAATNFKTLSAAAAALKAKADALEASLKTKPQQEPEAVDVSEAIKPVQGSVASGPAPTNANTAATVANAASNAKRKCHGKCKDGTSCAMNPVKGTDFCRHHANATAAPEAPKPAAAAPQAVARLFVEDGKGGYRPATEKEIWAALESMTKAAA